MIDTAAGNIDHIIISNTINMLPKDCAGDFIFLAIDGLFLEANHVIIKNTNHTLRIIVATDVEFKSVLSYVETYGMEV